MSLPHSTHRPRGSVDDKGVEDTVSRLQLGGPFLVAFENRDQLQTPLLDPVRDEEQSVLNHQLASSGNSPRASDFRLLPQKLDGCEYPLGHYGRILFGVLGDVFANRD